jgi:chromosome segregation ATPase
MSALAEFKRQLKRKMEGMRSDLGVVRQEREKLKAEISNLAGVIANGRQSTALLAELGKRERRLDKISDELLASTDDGLEMKLQKIEEFAMKRLRHIQGTARRRCASRKIGTGENTAPTSRLPQKGTVTSSAEMESIGRTSGWCRRSTTELL